jgi:hypothetical protein
MEEQPPSFLDRLQGLSHSAKIRVILAVAVVSIAGLGAIWAKDATSIFSSIDPESIIPNGSVLSATNYVTLEAFEESDGKHYLHFRVQNNTSDILNFPKSDLISLQINGRTVHPEKVTDRQQMPFVSKVLSNSTVYGILEFGKLDGNGGILEFDEMFFESQPSNVFRESVEVDLSDLPPVEELRS